MKIVKWIISIAFAIWGLLNLLTISNDILYLVNALISFGIAALICPLLEDKLKNFKYRWLVVAVLVVLEIIIYVVIGTRM